VGLAQPGEKVLHPRGEPSVLSSGGDKFGRMPGSICGAGCCDGRWVRLPAHRGQLEGGFTAFKVVIRHCTG
jgi:hypothetical protein